MAIDSLSAAGGLLAALRGEITRRADRKTHADGTSKAEEDAPPAARRRDKPALRSELADIVKTVTLEDATSMHGMRRRMVRAMLLWEFGPELREHPEWQPMLEGITTALEASPAHMKAFAALFASLKKR